MKKIIGILLATCMIAIGASCNSAKPISETNVIVPAKLSVGQQEIVDLVSIDEYSTAIFDYSAKDTFNGLEIWIECYKNGKMSYSFHGIEVDLDGVAGNRNGRIGIVLNHNRMTLAVVTDSQEKYIDAKTIETISYTGRAWGPKNDTVIIENEKEIILYGYAFYEKADIAYGGQVWNVQPEMLKKCLYAYLVKCKFSTKHLGGLTAEKIANIAKDHIKENCSQYVIDTIINFDTPIVEENVQCWWKEEKAPWKVTFNVFSILGPIVLYFDNTGSMIGFDLRV